MILSVTVNPSVDHTLFTEGLKVGDTNRVQRTERDAGGKGINVARVYAELGGDAQATGFLAGGPGAYVRSVLDRQGVKHSFIDVEGETRVNFSVESGDGPPTTFNERGPEISEAKFKELLSLCKEMAANASWLVLGGSLPPGLPQDSFKRIIQRCAIGSCKVVLDADGDPMQLGMEASPTFIKPNAKEAGRLLDRKVESVDEALRVATDLHSQLKKDSFVVISLGEGGAVLSTADGLFIGETPKVEARSTIGSGDSLIGGMLWALTEGHPLQEALRWGLAAGAATAMTDGTEIARRPDILKLLPEARVNAARP